MDAPPPVPTPEPLVVLDAGVGQPTVTVGDAVFDVESVSTPEQRAKGLSGRDYLADTSGMLFVFESGRTTSFWMKDMRFPLDFVWIGDQCTVVDTHSDVPAPSPTSASGSLPRYSSTTPSRYTLEINSGKIVELGIEVGDRVTFSGFSGTGVVC